MTLTDTHCHLDFNKFDPDREAVIQRALQSGLVRILIPGLDLESSRSAVRLASSHPILFAAIGFHPTEAGKWEGESGNKLLELAGSFPGSRRIEGANPPRSMAEKIVAIGEIGLDYYWDRAPHDLQQKVLKHQLDLAGILNLPVIIHSREKGDAAHGPCAEDLLKILDGWVAQSPAGNHTLGSQVGVLHSFSGSLETAQNAIRLGFYIGVTGPLTYKNADLRRKVIASLPLDRLLIETDAPFLAPDPQRGKRNEPAFVSHIADKIAEIHMTTREQVAVITTMNASRLFGWGG